MARFRKLAAPLLAGLLVALSAFPAIAEQNDPIIAGWQAHQDEHGPSHASGGRPELGPHLIGNPTTAVHTLRVGLRYSYTATGARSEWASFSHPLVELTGTVGAFHIIDKATGKQIAAGEPGDIYTVRHDGTDYVLTGPDNELVASVAGPVYFRGSSPENTFRVPTITRVNILTWTSWLTPEYYGDMEITRGASTPAGRLSLVNIVELETYLRGNVVNESPASFHPEALKTQAAAARGYAVANVGRFSTAHGFDIDDSPGSQVYRGKTSEHPNGNRAVAETKGIVASYNGRIISAFYSSSMAGHTENYEWSFSGLGNPAQAIPYLVGRYDGPAGTEPDPTTEAGQREFWAGAQSQVYDSRVSSNNPRNRATWTRTRQQVESHLKANLSLRTVVSGSTSNIGTLQKCDITLKSPTGRAVEVICTGSNAVWRYRNWDNVRRAFPHPSWGTLNNPAFLDHTYNEDGSLASITVVAGGWGHNVGMSQYGANGRGRAGQHFGEIMTFYFKGVALGSYPIDIKAAPAGGPRAHRQEFVSPSGQGRLELRPSGGMRGLNITINGEHDIKLSAEELSQSLVQVEISQYLTAGLNVIQYNPVGNQGQATALVVVYEEE
jgi:SpoIID/LytB domain protein